MGFGLGFWGFCVPQLSQVVCIEGNEFFELHVFDTQVVY